MHRPLLAGIGTADVLVAQLPTISGRRSTPLAGAAWRGWQHRTGSASIGGCDVGSPGAGRVLVWSGVEWGGRLVEVVA